MHEGRADGWATGCGNRAKGASGAPIWPGDPPRASDAGSPRAAANARQPPNGDLTDSLVPSDGRAVLYRAHATPAPVSEQTSIG
jgi:hypothetical protein